MKNNLKKILCALMAVMMCCMVMISCKDNTADTDSSSDASGTPSTDTNDGEKSFLLVENGLAKYKVIRDESSTMIERGTALQVKIALDAVTGITHESITASEYTNDKANELEILIGETNRPESIAAMSELTEADTYLVRITDKKIIIVGNSDNALKTAGMYFIEKYLGWRSITDYDSTTELNMSNGKEYKGKWVDPEIVPDDGKPDVLYGLSQDQVDEMFAPVLDGLFTGKTKEVIKTKYMGKDFQFHFPDIVYHNNEYWAYYIRKEASHGRDGVGLATSTDGINWEDKGCVMKPDQDYDMLGAYFAGIWIDTDGTFYMTYECKGALNSTYGELENIALATSTDGIIWEKKGVILYKNTSLHWQKANVGTPDLFKVGDMWYMTFHGFNFSDCQIGLAYGKDLYNLTVVEEPIISTVDGTRYSGTVGHRDVIYCDGYYYMVYEVSTDQYVEEDGTWVGFGKAKWSHMFARSRDMKTWEIAPGPQLIQMNGSEERRGFGYDGPAWMIVGKHIYVYMRDSHNSTTSVELILEK